MYYRYLVRGKISSSIIYWRKVCGGICAGHMDLFETLMANCNWKAGSLQKRKGKGLWEGEKAIQNQGYVLKSRSIVKVD